MVKFLTALFLAFALVASPAYAQLTSVVPIAGPSGGATPSHYLSAANTNSTLIKASPGTIYQIVAINTTVTMYYLKFYDLNVAPTCNTTTVVGTYPIPFGASNSGGGFTIPLPTGMRFTKGIGFCITSGIADNDAGSAATGIAVDILWK